MELVSATTSETKSARILALRSDCWKATASAMLTVLLLAMYSVPNLVPLSEAPAKSKNYSTKT